MRKIAAAALICGALVVPAQASAQDRAVGSLVDEFKKLDSRHVTAIVVGAVGGAVALHWVVGGSAASWIGAGAGALVGDWYYVEKMRDVSIAGVNKASALARDAVAELDAGLIQVGHAVSQRIDALR